MQKDDRKLSAKELWGEWVAVTIIFLLGIILFLVSINLKDPIKEVLGNIGFSLLGSAGASFIILILVGSSVGGLKKETNNLRDEIDKLHANLEQEIESIDTKVAAMSALVSEAHRLGLVAIGRSRESDNFEGGNNIVGRWRYFLENAAQVDLICFRDRMLFGREVFYPAFIEKIRTRLKNGSLSLRIIITSLDNPFNKEIDEWASKPDYTRSLITHARYILRQLCGGDLNPSVVREHQSLVPFTLIRGDDHLYIMFFIPKYTGGPIIELRPLDAIAEQKSTAAKPDDNDKLFQIYRSYFEDMWSNKAKPIFAPDDPQKA